MAEPDALVVMRWRALYAVYYLAHVEQGRTGLVIREALPRGATTVSPPLELEIARKIASGGAVYVDGRHQPLRKRYRFERAGAACADFHLLKLVPRARWDAQWVRPP